MRLNKILEDYFTFSGNSTHVDVRGATLIAQLFYKTLEEDISEYSQEMHKR